MELFKCPVCGKEFIPAPQHIYKAYIKGHVTLLCSWGCVLKLEREKEAKKKKPKEE